MLEFTTRAPGGGRSLDTWATLLDCRHDRARLPRARDRPDRLGGPGRAHRRHHAGAARPDDDVGAPAAARPAPDGRVHLPAAADDPGDRAGGRPRPGVRLGDLLLRGVLRLAVLRVHRAGAAVRLPRPRRRAVADRRQDPGRGGPDPRRELGHRDVAGGPAQHPHGGAARRRSCPWRWSSASSPSPACSTATTSRWRSTCSASATRRCRSRCRSPRCSSRSSLLFAVVRRPAAAPVAPRRARCPPSPPSATPPPPEGSASG